MQAEPMDSWRCEPCRREWHPRVQQWLPQAGFCHMTDCREATWRIVVHPRYGHEILLWPRPDAVIASYAVGEQGTITQQMYCATHEPPLGAPPAHPVLVGGAPHPEPVGACVALTDPRESENYVACFTPERHTFLRLWMKEELAMPDEQHARLLAQWNLDRAEVKEAAPSEDDDGHAAA